MYKNIITHKSKADQDKLSQRMSAKSWIKNT